MKTTHVIPTMLLAILMMTGCAATGPTFTSIPTAPSDKGTVVIYRLNQLLNSGGWPRIRIDDQKMDTLKTGGYAVYRVSPGTHEISLPHSLLWAWGRKWTIDIASEETQYYRIYFDFNGATRYGNNLIVDSSLRVELVDAEIATRELMNMKLASGGKK